MKETNGIGLGLSTAKILVEAQDGTINIESQDGIYTKVTLSIRVEKRLEKVEDRVQPETFFVQVKKIGKVIPEEDKVTDGRQEDLQAKERKKNMFGGRVE